MQRLLQIHKDTAHGHATEIFLSVAYCMQSVCLSVQTGKRLQRRRRCAKTETLPSKNITVVAHLLAQQ